MIVVDRLGLHPDTKKDPQTSRGPSFKIGAGEEIGFASFVGSACLRYAPARTLDIDLGKVSKNKVIKGFWRPTLPTFANFQK